MAKKYIDADAFRRSMYEEAFEKDSDMQKWDGGCWIRYKLFENMIDAQPTADVRENVRGEWINMFGHGICNICGYKGSPVLTNFCPNCGADMRERRTDE